MATGLLCLSIKQKQNGNEKVLCVHFNRVSRISTNNNRGGGEHYTNPSIKILLKARRLCKGLWVDGLCAFPAAYLGRGLILPEVSRAH